VYVGSCTAAAVVGIIAFLDGQPRAGGPVGDPNDFAFFLISAVPLAFGLATDAGRPIVFRAAAVLMSVAAAATLSRGALVAAVVMLGYALLAGVVGVRTVLGWLAAFAVLAAIVVVGYQSRLTTSISAKGQVAQQNVDERLVRWRAAAEMTADNPVLGLGPAGFRENYDRYINHEPADAAHHLDVAHEMYLETSAELGLPGLAAFGCIIVFGFTGARRAARAGPQRQLAGAVTVAVVGTAVAAAFLTEQYFLPVWLLAAFGAALDSGRRVA
jgi:putative inorganic carbon (hco3(-)) transporter